ncbi:MAG: rRNA maturation RNase YbeY [Acidobacteriaceae bacterium]
MATSVGRGLAGRSYGGRRHPAERIEASPFDTIGMLGSFLCTGGISSTRWTHLTMILTEPAIQTKFGRALRRRALAAFLAEASAAARLSGNISVLLTSDAEIRRLNRTFRHQDKATDVLSFPAGETASRRLLSAGDLAISVETAQRQADEAGHPLFVELQVLLLHGVLHLAGLDHESDNGHMARKEMALRRRFGLSAGLIERSNQATAPGAGVPIARRSSRR